MQAITAKNQAIVQAITALLCSERQGPPFKTTYHICRRLRAEISDLFSQARPGIRRIDIPQVNRVEGGGRSRSAGIHQRLGSKYAECLRCRNYHHMHKNEQGRENAQLTSTSLLMVRNEISAEDFDNELPPRAVSEGERDTSVL